MKIKLFIGSLFMFLSFWAFGQEDDKEENSREQNEFIIPDSLAYAKNFSPRIQRLVNDPLTPSKAAFYSAIVPGLGQAYLGKAWKIPLVYAAMGTSFYYYNLQNNQMKEYRTAYKQRLNGIFNDRFLEKDIPITTDQLLIGIEFHKNYRDIAMLLLAASYMLNILEANVSAHLLQFNVNDDLSITPDLIFDEYQRGIRLAVKF
ncbi:MAG: DUF5683 domain-containing protein [Flavobacteriaceae bacterium]|nr:DUF5683 domain-containing protein [Flavobacteriaceae bacterium]